MTRMSTLSPTHPFLSFLKGLRMSTDTPNRHLLQETRMNTLRIVDSLISLIFCRRGDNLHITEHQLQRGKAAFLFKL